MYSGQDCFRGGCSHPKACCQKFWFAVFEMQRILYTFQVLLKNIIVEYYYY